VAIRKHLITAKYSELLPKHKAAEESLIVFSQAENWGREMQIFCSAGNYNNIEYFKHIFKNMNFGFFCMTDFVF
jgi:hypothetical protein